MAHRICGVLAPVVTPFNADLSPDPGRLIAHCKWLLSQNCGLAVFGTNSEANSLSVDERSALLDAVVAAGVDPSCMMPGTGCCSITETVRLTAQAVKHGCAGVLMLPPFYYKDVGEEGLYRYFSEVMQRVGDARLRIYLYHIPPVAVVGITTGLVERLLAKYPDTIAGMKDSSGDWSNTKTFLDAFTSGTRKQRSRALTRGCPPSSLPEGEREQSSSFDVFVGSESFLLANLRHGGVGTISATANVNPAAIHKLYSDFGGGFRGRTGVSASTTDLEDGPQGRGHSDRLEEQQAKLNVVRDMFGKKYPMISALKQGIAIYANDPAWAKVRPPLVELTAEQAKSLEKELEGIGFAMPGIAKR
jgi:4-hydroxy-tetrahydrodipicolinate synthase